MEDLGVKKIEDRIKQNLIKARDLHPNIEATNLPDEPSPNGKEIKIFLLKSFAQITRAIKNLPFLEKSLLGMYRFVKNRNKWR